MKGRPALVQSAQICGICGQLPVTWKLQERYRRLLAEEVRLVSAKPAAHRLALVYPNTYHIGMSSLGFQSVYRMVNERADFCCERGFLPEPDEITLLRNQGGAL